ncbi:hypothetical protein [Listeria sp. ILCC797]|uniref:hypothetical protein n=1 Tax=Listeria sp. ILCC797 TaxID=1918333 RepID=UPI000B5896EC|nr:hypothetical protein [Listeria sp. ILCC797]
MKLEIKKPTHVVIEISRDNINIERIGKLNITQHSGQQYKTFNIKNITSIELKAPSFLSFGLIRFSIPGEDTIRIANMDPKTIQFTKKDYNNILALKKQIESIQNQ